MPVKVPFLSLTLCALALLTACSETPTSPTATPSGVQIEGVSQQPPPIPPRAGPAVQIHAIGANRFVAFGDSITWGTESQFDGLLFDSGPAAYPKQLADILTAHFPQPQGYVVANYGVPGEGAVEGSQRLAEVLANDRPQALLLLEGINDLNVGRSIGTVTAALGTMLDYARVYNTTVFISTMFQTYEADNPNTGQHRTNSASQVPALNAAIRQLAAGRQNVYLVDMYEEFGSNRSYVGGDGLHPTPLGYQVMARAFEDAIAVAFAVRGSIQ